MTTFEDPAADADEAQTALRALAHATRSIDDPRQIYPVLGSLTSATASLSQTLHQIAAFHDGPARKTGWAPANSAKARSAAYRVSCDLHRAGEVLHQVSEALGHAHQAEALLSYQRELPPPCLTSRPTADRGLSR